MFFRRRRREARNAAMKYGSWPHIWARCCVDWSEHIVRHETVLKTKKKTQTIYIYIYIYVA